VGTTLIALEATTLGHEFASGPAVVAPAALTIHGRLAAVYIGQVRPRLVRFEGLGDSRQGIQAPPLWAPTVGLGFDQTPHLGKCLLVLSLSDYVGHLSNLAPHHHRRYYQL
jgi:hypothetical protein